MKTKEQRIQRLEAWNRGLIILLALLLLGSVGFVLNNRLWSNIHSLTVHWETSGEIKFSSPSDGPLVVTHLVSSGNTEGEKMVARLPYSVAIVDSAGAEISDDEVKTLVWLNIYGQPVLAPKAGSKINALYVRPQVTPARSTKDEN